MAARRALEWIGMLKAWLDFRYEISDLLVWLDLALLGTYLATSLESNHRTEHDYQYLRSFIIEPTSFSPQKLSTDLDIGLICGTGSCYTKENLQW